MRAEANLADWLTEVASFSPVKDLQIIKRFFTVDPSLDAVSEKRLYDILADSGILLEGHFSLLSGKHSKYFIRFANLARNTDQLLFVSQLIAEKIWTSFPDVDVLIAPETAGSYLANTIGILLNKKYNKNVELVFAKTDEHKRPTSLINYMHLRQGSKVLLVNDMVTTGAGVDQLGKLALGYQASILGIVVFASRKKLNEWDFPDSYGSFSYCLVDASRLEEYTYNVDEGKKDDGCPICMEEKTNPILSRFLN